MTHPAIEQLLQHTSALRRLARDLVGASAADDVLQDVAVEVLRAPRREPGSVLGWLRSVVHHVASKRRRSEAIRRRHETAAASERSFETSGAATADSMRLLTEWVTALPEPYRSTLLARYVQELTPAAIAEASGVPVRTVKTRLQRGLQLLRERGDRSGSDWRGAFVLAFGFAVETSDVAATAAGAAGALTMGSMGKSFVAVGALVLAALGAWQWSGGYGTAVPQSSSPPPAVPAVASVAVAPSKPSAEPPAAERTPAAAPTQPQRARADELVVHVVDAGSGEPVLAYGLREHVSPTPNLLGSETPLLHAGPHADGRLVLPARSLDNRVYAIEDAAGRYLPSAWFAAGDAVERDGERTIEVRLPAPVEVRVKVVRERTGEAIAGTRVELLRPWLVPHPVKPHTLAAPTAHFRAQSDDNAILMNFMGGRALLLGDVATDAVGLAVLRVPPGERLALRLTGALHRTRIVEPWQAPEPRADVVLAVEAGAAVRGRVTPAAALAQLRARAPEYFENQTEFAQTWATGVRLLREGTDEARPPGPLGREPVTLADDGSFEIGGLAPGTWRMFFQYALVLDPDAPQPSDRLPRMFEIELPKVEGLADGELRIVDLDVGDWVPGTLRAQLPRDDLADKGILTMRQIASVGPPQVTQRCSLPAVRVRGERVEVPLPPGRYLVMWNQLVLGEVAIQPRGVTTIESALDADTASIQVFEADGTTPVPGRLNLRRPGWDVSIDVDANGGATFEAMPRGWDLKATFHRWNAEKPKGPFTDPIDLGTIRTDGKPIVLRLPPR